MPSLGSHLLRAYRVAERLGLPEIEADRGAFLLGATAPDIRVITRRDRIHTHFFNLECLDHQDSVSGMFEAHPELADAHALDLETRAFVAGFITHLVLDEVYIETMFREFFGADAPVEDKAFANVLDRALQFEMNRREFEDGVALSDILEQVRRSPTSNAVSFVEDEFLERWREVVVDFASQGPTWERFPRMMNIHLQRAGFSEAEVERFSLDGPALARQSFDYVTDARVERYIEEATAQAAERVARYLGEQG